MEKISWLNFWDQSDPFAYGLKVLFEKENGEPDSETDATKLFDVKVDKGFSRYFIPALAHIGYWKDEAVYKAVIKLMKLDTASDEEEIEVKNKPLVRLNRNLAYGLYFLGRIGILFLIVVFLNRLLYPLHQSWIKESSEAGSIEKWIFFVVAFVAPFLIIGILEEISFLRAGLWEMLIKWLRKLLVVGWWGWAFILCIMLSPISNLFIKPFISDDGKAVTPTLTDRVGYLTALVVLYLIWKLLTTVHRGLMQMWQYTLGENTGYEYKNPASTTNPEPASSNQSDGDKTAPQVATGQPH